MIETIWTPLRVELLKKLYHDGLSFDLIGQELGTTRNSAIGKAHRLKLFRTNHPKHTRWDARLREPRARNTVEKINAARLRTARGQTRVRQPPTPIIEVVAPHNFLGITFLDLDQSHCRYPRGEGSNMLFCGQPKIDGHSYCAHCYGLTHTKPLNLSREERYRRIRQGAKNHKAQVRAA